MLLNVLKQIEVNKRSELEKRRFKQLGVEGLLIVL